MRESMEGFGPQKRPLTDVKEEPQEREDEFEMVNGFDDSHDNDRKPFCSAQKSSTESSFHSIPADGISTNNSNTDAYHEDDEGIPSLNDYDLADDTQMDIDFGLSQSLKRQRAGDSAFGGLTSRFGSKIPSLSRKWRHRRKVNSPTIDDYSPEPKLSRANSTRASSLAGSLTEYSDPQDPQLPPTPARSVLNGELENSLLATIDIQKANAPQDSDDIDAKASTPLLPPIMTKISSQVEDVPFQSPLQSPTIAPSPTVAEQDFFSVKGSGHGPYQPGPPSPPLSNKPSISSFHRQKSLTQVQPSSEISAMLMAGSSDEWSNKLGHANFTIHPEPYLPETCDPSACKQIRTDWDLARCNYMKHLMRTGEHYGATSKIYRLTEEKWSEIDTIWKRNSEISISRAADNGFEADLSLSQCSAAGSTPLKLPLLNGPRSEGKFPKLGDQDIVGPMEQIASQVQRRPSRKAGLFKLLHSVLPSNSSLFGRTVRSRSVSP